MDCCLQNFLHISSCNSSLRRDTGLQAHLSITADARDFIDTRLTSSLLQQEAGLQEHSTRLQEISGVNTAASGRPSSSGDADNAVQNSMR